MTTAELLLSIDDTLALIKTLPRRRVRRITVLIVPPAPPAAVDEIAAMRADANALESGQRVAAYRLTDAQVEEMNSERVGEFETYSPWR